ncbi:MAG: hypothetical protein WCF26_21890 [Candidatus Sulfotelmatobacter sp.]
MSSTKSQIRAIGAVAALVTLAFAISCRGFFVNPTLNSIAIGPQTLNLAPTTSYQMQAIGTYSDGSTGDVTSKASWTSSDPSVASFSSSVIGYITATTLANIPNPPGTTTVSASVGAINSTSGATVTVCPVVNTMTISASPTTVSTGQAITFTALATFQGVSTQTNVTTEVTWNVGSTSVLTITGGIGTPVSTGSTTVSASLCGGTSNTITITVT